jgi:hypothetical protein
MSVKELLSSRPFQRVIGAIEDIVLELKRLRHAVEVSNKIQAFRLYEDHYDETMERGDPLGDVVNTLIEETLDVVRSSHGSGDERPETG